MKVFKSAFLRSVIFLYRAIFSSTMGRQCRFEPTCSCYAHQVFEKYSFFYACFLVIKRLVKCQPFYKWGQGYLHDAVPEYQEKYRLKIKNHS
jgi:uncharacterized protein